MMTFWETCKFTITCPIFVHMQDSECTHSLPSGSVPPQRSHCIACLHVALGSLRTQEQGGWGRVMRSQGVILLLLALTLNYYIYKMNTTYA